MGAQTRCKLGRPTPSIPDAKAALGVHRLMHAHVCCDELMMARRRIRTRTRTHTHAHLSRTQLWRDRTIRTQALSPRLVAMALRRRRCASYSRIPCGSVWCGPTSQPPLETTRPCRRALHEASADAAQQWPRARQPTAHRKHMREHVTSSCASSARALQAARHARHVSSTALCWGRERHAWAIGCARAACPGLWPRAMRHALASGRAL